MAKLRKLMAVVGFLTLLGVLAPGAQAAVSITTPTVGSPISGESFLPCISPLCPTLGSDPPTIFIRVDWMVFAPDDPSAPIANPGLYEYIYEVEATTGPTITGGLNQVSALTVTTPIAFVAQTNINAGPLVIDSEINPFDGHALTCCVTPVSQFLTSSSATWVFDPAVVHDAQSVLLIGFSPLPPVPGQASALDSLPGSPWSTTGAGGEPVPVPGVTTTVPEPMSLMLVGLGMVGMGVVIRRRLNG